MKNLKKLSVLFILFFASCKSKPEALIVSKYIDSLFTINTLSVQEKAIELDVKFWKDRLDAQPGSYTNTIKYAGMLAARFHLNGDINDLQKAENLIDKLNKENKESESGLFRTLANYSSIQHRFSEANNLNLRALKIGDNRYETELQLFDNAFELGKIDFAKTTLAKLKKNYEYAYYFRLAKLQHYEGDLEGAILSMEKASNLTNGSLYLQQAAISNMADLQLHSGDFENAAINYKKSIGLDKADYHSITGLGLIALNHDNNIELANYIFQYIAAKTKSPDIYFRLIQLAQQKGDFELEKKYAEIFAEKATLPVYGNMYNKYLIELYDGILNNPKQMLAIAEKEIKNRNTPQTNSWYAWALYKNNQKSKAMDCYKKYVSEEPLEGLELFYMAKMMAAEKKAYHSEAFLKAAYKNRFDLSPEKRIYLEKTI